jgi:hypothetical protein
MQWGSALAIHEIKEGLQSIKMEVLYIFTELSILMKRAKLQYVFK